MLFKSFKKSLMCAAISCAILISSSTLFAYDNYSSLQPKPKSTLKDQIKKGMSRCYAYLPGCDGSDSQRNLVPIQLFEPTYILPAVIHFHLL